MTRLAGSLHPAWRPKVAPVGRSPCLAALLPRCRWSTHRAGTGTCPYDCTPLVNTYASWLLIFSFRRAVILAPQGAAEGGTQSRLETALYTILAICPLVALLPCRK